MTAKVAPIITATESVMWRPWLRIGGREHGLGCPLTQAVRRYSNGETSAALATDFTMARSTIF
jgi:hypothetical protein